MRTNYSTAFGLWELAVLALLREHSMHPYEMKRLLRDRHKEELLALKRGSLYHAIARLARQDLIQAIRTGRHGRRPERTTYRITPNGREQLFRWLRQMAASPKREPSEFMTCLSFLIHLEPKQAMQQLRERANKLEEEIDDLQKLMMSAIARVSRINLLESEYLMAMRRAELGWIQRVAKQMQSGKFTWDFSKIMKQIWESRIRPQS